MIVLFFKDTATTEIYTLSLHDALPICRRRVQPHARPQKLPARSGPANRAPEATAGAARQCAPADRTRARDGDRRRSEEHTSELQSRQYLVCRLLLDKKNTFTATPPLYC